MDWFPLFNSLRIAAISTAVVFFAGICAAYYIAKLPPLWKGVLDVALTLPLVLPPTVVGYLLLRLLGPARPLGAFLLEQFGVKMVMNWWSAIFATVVVAFPLMYRTARGSFESFDRDLADAGRTLGLSNTWIFWYVRMPVCRQGILAGAVLSFARAPLFLMAPGVLSSGSTLMPPVQRIRSTPFCRISRMAPAAISMSSLTVTCWVISMP